MKEDILSLEPRVPDQDRRQFLVTKLTAGFALAVLPVSAQTITTDTKGLEAGEVKIPVPDGQIPAYRAMTTFRIPAPPCSLLTSPSRTKYTPGASARTSFAPGCRSRTLRPVTSSSAVRSPVPGPGPLGRNKFARFWSRSWWNGIIG